MERVLVIKRDNMADAEESRDRHAVYVDRLSCLRDQILVQDQKKLTRDVERFGISPLTQESEQYRLKMEYQSHSDFLKPQRRGMVTSFNTMKQEELPPLPGLPSLLQGKQLLESSKPKRKNLTTSNDIPYLTERQRVNETVRINLARLPVQARPSIPSIGRRAVRQEELTVGCHALKSLNQKSSQQQQTVHNTKYRLRPLISESPRGYHRNSPKLKSKTPTYSSGDGVDMEYLNQYFLLCSIPQTDRSDISNHKIRKSQRIKSIKDVNVPISPDYSKNTYNSDGALSLKRSFYRPLGSKTNIKENPQINFSDTDKNYGREMHCNFGGNDDDRVNDNSVSKVRIVVDMPNIVLNTASPEPGSSRETTFVGALSRTCKQSEMRQKEIKNLLEDVKELNKRSETFVESAPVQPDGQDGDCHGEK